MNLIPWRLFDILKTERSFGLFENLELLNGYTKCDYSIFNASSLKKMIAYEKEMEYNESILDEFIHGIASIDFKKTVMQTLKKHDLLECKEVPYNDIFLSNPLTKCFEFEKMNPASADILVDYFLSLRRSRSLNEILMNCMRHFLHDKFEHP